MKSLEDISESLDYFFDIVAIHDEGNLMEY